MCAWGMGVVLSVCVYGYYIILCAAIYESDIFSDKITSHCRVPSALSLSLPTLPLALFIFFALFLF